MNACRACAAAVAAALWLALPPTRAAAQTQLPRCTVADAELVTKLDSAYSTAGDSFIFKIAERVSANAALPEIPKGTRGYGIVAFADHAHGSGQPGRLVVEPRFVQLVDRTRVPVLADPQLSESFAQGATRNLSGALQFVPGFGLAVSGYNALHRGREVVIEKGTAFRVVIGDDLAQAECFVPPPSAFNVR